jgi:1-acyl-sn-glycerol-3-phosphate acyltransferase
MSKIIPTPAVPTAWDVTNDCDPTPAASTAWNDCDATPVVAVYELGQQPKPRPAANHAYSCGVLELVNDIFGTFFWWFVLGLHFCFAAMGLLLFRCLCFPIFPHMRNFWIGFIFRPVLACVRISTSIIVSGDTIPRGHPHPFILMANHQSVADFLLVALYLKPKRCANGNILWAVWVMLAYLPLGWMLKAGGTACWLQGQGEKGLQMIEQMRQKLDHFMRDHRQSFILFPEGTIMKGSEKTKSQAYASRMGFVHLEHLLLPRHKALHIAVQTLAAQGIDELYDVTIHYPANTQYAQQPYHMGRVFAILPRGFTVLFDVKKYSIRESKLAELDEEGFRDWLHQVYQRKEVMLARGAAGGDIGDTVGDDESYSLGWAYFELLIWIGPIVGVYCWLCLDK